METIKTINFYKLYLSTLVAFLLILYFGIQDINELICQNEEQQSEIMLLKSNNQLLRDQINKMVNLHEDELTNLTEEYERYEQLQDFYCTAKYGSGESVSWEVRYGIKINEIGVSCSD